MSTSTLESPFQSSRIPFLVFFLGLGVTLAFPLDFIASGVNFTWSEISLGVITLPYPSIMNFNMRIFFELLFGPFLLLYSIPKIKTGYDTKLLNRLLTSFWSFFFFTFGSIGVFSSLLGISLFGISNNVLSFFFLIYGPVLFLYVWREKLPNFLQNVNNYASLVPPKFIYSLATLAGIGMILIIPLEITASGVTIILSEMPIFGISLLYPAIVNFPLRILLELYLGIVFLLWVVLRYKPNWEINRSIKWFSTLWSSLFLVSGFLGFLSSILNSQLFGVTDTPFTPFFIIYGLMIFLITWNEQINKRFSSQITHIAQKIHRLRTIYRSQIFMSVIFLMGVGLTMIILLDFLGSKIEIVLQLFSIFGIIFPYPTLVNLNVRVFLEILIGPLIIVWSGQKINFHDLLQNLSEQETWKFFIFPFLLFLIVFLRSYLLFFEHAGVTEVGVEILMNTLRSSFFVGSIYLLLGIGLSLTFKILNFANFAHGELVVYGPYIIIFSLPPFLVFIESFLSNSGIINILALLEPFLTPIILFLQDFLGKLLGINLVFIPFLPLLAIYLVTAFISSAILALIVDFLVFRPLRNRNATPRTLMIASIGVSFMIRVLLTDTYSQGFSQHVIQIIGQPRLYDLHTVIIVLGVLFVIILDLLITKTKLGKGMRAMADNPDLAQTSGISKVKVIALVWIIGAGLAGMGGVLRFLANMTLFPDRGFLLLLPTFAVVILGGIGSYRGAIVAGYIVGFAENVGAFLVSTLRITSFEQLRLEIPIILGDLSIEIFKIEPSLLGELYQVAIGFVILVIVLIIKPTGIFGEELAKER